MGRDAFVDEFFIGESHRGHGIGRSALKLVIEQMKPLAIQALHLEVASNNERARKLYQAAGFTSRKKYHLMTRKTQD